MQINKKKNLMNLLSFYIYVFIFLKLLHLTFHKYFLNNLIIKEIKKIIEN